jgi:hypothetical protein
MVTKVAEAVDGCELSRSRIKLATVMTMSWCSIAVTAMVRSEGLLGIALLPPINFDGRVADFESCIRPTAEGLHSEDIGRNIRNYV